MFDCPEFYEFLTHFCAIISDFCAIFIVLCAINHIYSLTFLIPHPTSVIPSLSRDLSTPVEMTQKSSAYRCRQSFAVMIKTVIAHISANRRRAECQCRARTSTTEARTDGAARGEPSSLGLSRVATEEGKANEEGDSHPFYVRQEA